MAASLMLFRWTNVCLISSITNSFFSTPPPSPSLSLPGLFPSFLSLSPSPLSLSISRAISLELFLQLWWIIFCGNWEWQQKNGTLAKRQNRNNLLHSLCILIIVFKLSSLRSIPSLSLIVICWNLSLFNFSYCRITVQCVFEYIRHVQENYHKLTRAR